MSDRSQILITGGTGFFGRVLVRELLTAGQSLRIISRSGALAEHERVSMCRGDIGRLQDLRAAIHGCTAVFHCAAEKTDSGKMTDTNVLGTQLLFDVATEAGVKFFCHVSSAVVVGRVRQRILDESTPCSPTNLYEETKLAAEQIVSTGLDGGKVAILRPTHIFGAQTLLPWLRTSLSSKVGLFLRGNENSHLVYVQDVAAAAIFLWRSGSGNRVETFNVSSDDESGGTHREAHAVFTSVVAGAPRSSVVAAPLFVPYWLRLMRRGNSNHGDVIYSSRKLRAAGFEFPFGLRAGLVQVAGSLRDRDPHLAGTV
jgi:nucleoside-diphosphate-sugar epimerase